MVVQFLDWEQHEQFTLELRSELVILTREQSEQLALELRDGVILTQEQCERLKSERHNRLEGCIIAYFKRFYLEENPSGDFDFDGIERFERECQQLNASAGCGMAHSNGLPPWHPDDSERRPCCADYPQSHSPRLLYTHCRSIEHLANLYDVDVRFLDQRLDAIRIEIPTSIRPWVDNTDSFSYTLGCFCHNATEYAERMCINDRHEWRQHYLNYIEGRKREDAWNANKTFHDVWRRHYLDYINGSATITPDSGLRQRFILSCSIHESDCPPQDINAELEAFEHLDHLATKFAELMCGDDLREQEWRRHYLNCIKDPTVADNKKKYP